MTRTVFPAPHDLEPLAPGESFLQDHATFDVVPRALFPLDGRRYALVLSEIKRHGAHGEGGEIGVAYLSRSGGRWRLQHVWLELLYSGIGGRPAPDGLELHRYGGNPLLFARSAWCGMDECSEWIGTVCLSPNGPVAFQDVLAGATFPSSSEDLEADTSCPNVNVRATIHPPESPDALFSVRYDGWTAAPGTIAPRTPMHLRTSYVPSGTELTMQPVIPVPTCSR